MRKIITVKMEWEIDEKVSDTFFTSDSFEEAHRQLGDLERYWNRIKEENDRFIRIEEEEEEEPVCTKCGDPVKGESGLCYKCA